MMFKSLSDYETYLINTKHASGNTIISYLRDVKQFAQWLSEQGERDLPDADQDEINDYISYLEETGRSRSTICRAVASLRNFYAYLIAQGQLDHSPVVGIHFLRGDRHIPQILTSQEIDLLLAQPSGDEPKALRDQAILQVMYATGLRVTEIVNLDVDDVNLSASYLRCSGKKTRMVPMYPDAVRSLSAYLHKARPSMVVDPKEKALFLNINGTRLTRQGIWKALKHYQQTANIHKDITPHTLRHSFAVHLLENGADLQTTQEILGHSDISSTQFYTQFLNDNIKNVYKKCHPKA